MKLFFALVGLSCLGYCAYMLGMQSLNQSYGNWVFEQHIAGREDVGVSTYLREDTPFGFLIKNGSNDSGPEAAPTSPNNRAMLANRHDAWES